MRKRRTRIPVLRLAACTVIGVVLTVGVAWAFALRGLRTAEASWRPVDAEWPGSVPAACPPQPRLAKREGGTGVTWAWWWALDPEWADHPESTEWQFYEAASGYPVRAMAQHRLSRISRGRLELLRDDGFRVKGQNLALPLNPLAAGFALDTAFYAAIALTLWSAPPAIRRRLRRARGQCSACGYNLQGAPTATCPECGS